MTNGHVAVVAVLAGLVAGYLSPWLTYWWILGWQRLDAIRTPDRFTLTKRPYDGTGDHTTGVPLPPYTITPSLTGAGQPAPTPDTRCSCGHWAAHHDQAGCMRMHPNGINTCPCRMTPATVRASAR